MKELGRGDRVYLLLSTNLLSPWSTTQKQTSKTKTPKGVCILGFLEMKCEICGGTVQEGPACVSLTWEDYGCGSCCTECNFCLSKLSLGPLPDL